MLKDNKYLFSFLCYLFVSIIVVLAACYYGYPNEFVYNIPSIKNATEGLIYSEAIITYSKQFTGALFFKYLFELLLVFSQDLTFIYICYALLNITIFWAGGIVLYKDKLMGSLYLLVFFLLSGKLLISGIPSSFYYSTLILGFALFLRGHHLLHYVVAVITYFIYPIASMMILASSCLGFLFKKKYKYACLSFLVAFSILLISWSIGYDIALDDYYTNYLGWKNILSDDYFFSDSMILIAESSNFLSLFMSIFYDTNKIGTTLFSLSPFETPRFVGYFVILFSLYFSKMKILEKYKDFNIFFIALTFIYITALIFSFHFYYPNRYVIGPLFIFIACLCFDSLKFLCAYSQRYFIGVSTASVSLLALFYIWHPIGGTPANLNNYLSYQRMERGDSFDKLKERLANEKNKTIAASPRLSEMLMVSDIPIVPMITYKFIDKTTPLKNSGKEFWKLYLAKSEEEIIEQCKSLKVDLVIFEEKLLNLIKGKRFDETRRNFMMPHRDAHDLESLAIIDYPLDIESIGHYQIYNCAKGHNEI